MATIEQVADALHIVNQYARRYERRSKQLTGRREELSEAFQQRRRALYRLKSDVLDEICSEAERVEMHLLSGDEYYCLTIGNRAFHVPSDSISSEISPSKTADMTGEIDKSVRSTHSVDELFESLRLIESELGLDANEYLDRHVVCLDGAWIQLRWEYNGGRDVTDGSVLDIGI